MRISDNVDKYLQYYFDSIHIMGNLSIVALQQMAELKGQGAEYISCSFDPDDEDFVEGKVTLFFWKPADDEDTIVFVSNKVFYDNLEELCKKYLKSNTQDTEKVNDLLKQIRIHLLL